MTTLSLLAIAIGVAPLAAGHAYLPPSCERPWRTIQAGEILLCALAFNLTFLWQELWLVIPKALTPGLHPVLYHNDHRWSGHAPVEELLEGSGALATFASGIVFAGASAIARRTSLTWRLFFFWMTFEGLNQSLTQLAMGTALPGNDVGRSLAYLETGMLARAGILAVIVLAMTVAGTLLAQTYPLGGQQRANKLTKAFAERMLLTAGAATVLVVPFRWPRDVTEVVLIPLLVNLIGVGWLAVGAKLARRGQCTQELVQAGILGPALALAAALMLFQFVLRQGVAF